MIQIIITTLVTPTCVLPVILFIVRYKFNWDAAGQIFNILFMLL